MFSLSTIFVLLDITLHSLVAGIPHDIGAVIVFLLVGGMLFLVWYGSRPSTMERHGGSRSSESPTGKE